MMAFTLKHFRACGPRETAYLVHSVTLQGTSEKPPGVTSGRFSVRLLKISCLVPAPLTSPGTELREDHLLVFSES